ncbi:MAG: hypothetical protein V1728_03975 [Candidatus Micrarchaeota archaeon]
MSLEDRLQIREYYLTHAVSVRSIAGQFGVSAASVWRAITLK